jgi:PAS domain-containing protein
MRFELLLALDDGVETPLDFDKAAIGMSSSEIVQLASAFRRFGVMKIDLSNGAMVFSPDACRMHGLPVTAEPIDVAELFNRLHPEDAERIVDAFDTATRSRCGWSYQYRIRQPDGGWRWARLVKRYRASASGDEFVGIVYDFMPPAPSAELVIQERDLKAGRDIFSRMSMSLTGATSAIHLQDSIHPFRDMARLRHPAIDVGDDDLAELICRHRLYGFFRQDIESGYSYFSRAAYEIYGLPYRSGPANIAEMIRRTHPDDVSLVSTAFEAAARHKAMFHIIHRYARPTGYKTLRLIGNCRETPDGRTELYGSIYEFYDSLSIIGFSS